MRQLTHEILAACAAAAAPFSWLRVQGFDRLTAALAAGAAGDAAALARSLDQTYSQVLDAALSALDRQLAHHAPPPPPAPSAGTKQQQQQEPAGAAAGTAAAAAASASTSRQLPPGGLAPDRAPPEEWAAALRALQGACVLHRGTRSVLGSAQYLQLLANRACSCPPAAPPALDALLAVAAPSPEAQALLAGGGGLAAIARLARGRLAQPGARGSAGGGGGAGGGASSAAAAAAAAGSGAAAAAGLTRDVVLRVLGFLHVFVGHVLPRSVRAGVAHPNTLRSSQQLLASELGQGAAEALCRPADDSVLLPAAAAAAAAAADVGGSGGGGSGGGWRVDAVAEAALAAMASAGRSPV